VLFCASGTPTSYIRLPYYRNGSLTCLHSSCSAVLEDEKKTEQTKNRAAENKIGLPDLDQSKAAVIGSLPSPESPRGYRYAIDEFIEWYCPEPTRNCDAASFVIPSPHLLQFDILR